MLIIGLIILGLGVGVLSTFFGVGGGILMVPLLYAFFPKILPQVVIATSLSVIFLNCLINTRNFVKSNLKPNWKVALSSSLFMGIGSYIGSVSTNLLDPKTIKLIFAIVLVLSSIKVVTTKDPITQNERPDLSTTSYILMMVLTLFGGALAGVTGLGGGVVVIPVFLNILKLPINQIPLYSNIAMGGATLVGALNFALMDPPSNTGMGESLYSLQLGYLSIPLLALIFIGSTVSSPLGVKLRAQASGQKSKFLFAALLLLMATRIIYKLQNA